jgi:hypothetical protein
MACAVLICVSHRGLVSGPLISVVSTPELSGGSANERQTMQKTTIHRRSELTPRTPAYGLAAGVDLVIVRLDRGDEFSVPTGIETWRTSAELPMAVTFWTDGSPDLADRVALESVMSHAGCGVA